MTLGTLAPAARTRRVANAWHRYELPTMVLALAVYLAWAALVWWHAALPKPLWFVLGGCLAQLHASLQHEAIHALRHVPKPLRWALVWPPLNLWLPFPLFHASHSRHHVNFYLTHPERDTESVFHSATAWRGYGALRRGVLLANQTLAFRMAIEPGLQLASFWVREARRLAKGDRAHAKAWLWHAASLAPVLGFVTGVAGMNLLDYVLCFVYPGLMLGALRAFTEHRWDDAPHERVAIVESNAFFGLLFLYNNLHHVHHRFPTMPWYRIPAHFRAHRAALLHANGHFYYRGYGEIAWRHLLRPVFRPVHPLW